MRRHDSHRVCTVKSLGWLNSYDVTKQTFPGLALGMKILLSDCNLQVTQTLIRDSRQLDLVKNGLCFQSYAKIVKLLNQA